MVVVIRMPGWRSYTGDATSVVSRLFDLPRAPLSHAVARTPVVAPPAPDDNAAWPRPSGLLHAWSGSLSSWSSSHSSATNRPKCPSGSQSCRLGGQQVHLIQRCFRGISSSIGELVTLPWPSGVTLFPTGSHAVPPTANRLDSKSRSIMIDPNAPTRRCC